MTKRLKVIFMKMICKKVYKEEDSLWLVEKLIKKRKRKGQTEWLLKFQSWPDKFNQWVKESDIVDLRQK